MIWLFWSLVGLVVIGLPVLARRNRSPLRPAGPTTAQTLRAVSRTSWELLWTVSYPFGLGGWHRRGPDASMDYIRQEEAQSRGRRNSSDPQ